MIKQLTIAETVVVLSGLEQTRSVYCMVLDKLRRHSPSNQWGLFELPDAYLVGGAFVAGRFDSIGGPHDILNTK